MDVISDNAETELPVQKQLEAYNARDIDGFMQWWADDCQYYEFPARLLASGAAEIRERHVARFREPNLHGTLVKRIAVANIVVDQETVTRVRGAMRREPTDISRSLPSPIAIRLRAISTSFPRKPSPRTSATFRRSSAPARPSGARPPAKASTSISREIPRRCWGIASVGSAMDVLARSWWPRWKRSPKCPTRATSTSAISPRWLTPHSPEPAPP